MRDGQPVTSFDVTHVPVLERGLDTRPVVPEQGVDEGAVPQVPPLTGVRQQTSRQDPDADHRADQAHHVVLRVELVHEVEHRVVDAVARSRPPAYGIARRRRTSRPGCSVTVLRAGTLTTTRGPGVGTMPCTSAAEECESAAPSPAYSRAPRARSRHVIGPGCSATTPRQSCCQSPAAMRLDVTAGLTPHARSCAEATTASCRATTTRAAASTWGGSLAACDGGRRGALTRAASRRTRSPTATIHSPVPQAPFACGLRSAQRNKVHARGGAKASVRPRGPGAAARRW